MIDDCIDYNIIKLIFYNLLLIIMLKELKYNLIV